MILYGLGAIDKDMGMTPLGHSMLKYPLDPSRSKILLSSIARQCTLDILDILSLSIESPIFMEPPSTTDRDEVSQARAAFTHRDGDHMTMLNVLRSYESVPRADVKGRKEWCKARWVNERGLKKAILARDQMKGICEKEGVDWRTTSGDDSEPILRSLVDGLFTNTAILRDGEYKQLVGSSVSRSSSFFVLSSRFLSTRCLEVVADSTSHLFCSLFSFPADGQDPPFLGPSLKTSTSDHLRRDRKSLFFSTPFGFESKLTFFCYFLCFSKVHTKSTYARNVSSVQFAWIQEQAMFQQRSA